MRKFFLYSLAIVVLVVPVVSFAAMFRAGEMPSVGVAEQITGDLYMAGSSVTSAGSIAGDLIAGGGNIVVNGNVAADVIAAGGNISIFSNVGDDLRVTGGNIVIDGSVGGDVLAGGGQITLSGAGVTGDVVIGGGSVRIDAPVMGKLKLGGRSVFINAPITGDINIDAESVTLGSSAVISGNLSYKASAPLTMEAGAVVNGKVTFTPMREKMISSKAVAAIFSAFLVWKFFALLASALIIGMIFRRYCKEILNLASKRPLLQLVRGLVFIAAMPIICILLFATVVGIPLGILGILTSIILMLFAWMMTPIVLGSFVYQYFSKKELEVSWQTILLGVFIFVLLSAVPYIGGIVKCLLMLLTLGCLVSLKWRLASEWR